MKLIIAVLFMFSFSYSYAQNNRYLKLSAGRMFFSYPEDVSGYGIYSEYSASLGRHTGYWKHFQLGGELAFEKGSREYIVKILPQTDYKRAVYHESDLSAYAKISYYPIGSTFLKGLNVALGPTVGYYFYSREIKESNIQTNSGLVLSQSETFPGNNLVAGYKISAGYEYYFKRLLVGARLDWGNNQAGNIQTMYGVKFGWQL